MGSISRGASRSLMIAGIIVLVIIIAAASIGLRGPGETTTTVTSPTVKTETVTKSEVRTVTETKVETQVKTQVETATKVETVIPEVAVVRFAGWSAGETELKNYEKLIKAFEEIYPNIKVKQEVITQMFHENILASYGAGVAPDVFYLDVAWAQIFIEKGALLPLSDYIDSSFLAQYYEFLLEGFKGPDGKVYGIPKDWSMLMLFYNKKLFEQAGLSEPPKTWDELVEYAKIIADKTGTPGLAIYLGGFNRYMPVALSYGASQPWFDDPSDAAWFDQPAVRESLAWYINLYREGKLAREEAGKTPYVVSPQDVGAGWLGDAFGSQKVAMVISGNWMIPFLADQFPDFKYGEDWDIAPVPAGPKGRVTMAYTVALAINSGTQVRDAALEFLKYVVGPEGQKKIVIELGHTLPSIKALAEDPDMWPQHKKSLSFVDQYTHVQVFMWGPKTGELEGTISDIMASAMRGEISIDEAIESIKAAIQDAFSG
ncbi:MAG: ABC transporter substrate-binding protein [Desulfurococcales archaeon]|nr:ABC transporter substrate-binding protein [Desulfurococcales archaeon]